MPLFQALELERVPSRVELELELSRKKGAGSTRRKGASSTVSNVSPVAGWRSMDDSPNSGNPVVTLRQEYDARIAGMEKDLKTILGVFAGRGMIPPPTSAPKMKEAAGEHVGYATPAILEAAGENDGDTTPSRLEACGDSDGAATPTAILSPVHVRHFAEIASLSQKTQLSPTALEKSLFIYFTNNVMPSYVG